MFPSSFRTSCGTSHSICWVVISSVFVWMSIFCFVVVRMKFVSSRIFMWILGREDLYKLGIGNFMGISDILDFRIGMYNVFFGDLEGYDSILEFDKYMRELNINYNSWFFDAGSRSVVITERPFSGGEELGIIEHGVECLVSILP
jgi:hypothetical protein